MHPRINVTYIYLQNCGAQTIQEGFSETSTVPYSRSIGASSFPRCCDDHTSCVVLMRISVRILAVWPLFRSFMWFSSISKETLRPKIWPGLLCFSRVIGKCPAGIPAWTQRSWLPYSWSRLSLQEISALLQPPSIPLFTNHSIILSYRQHR